MNTTKHLLLYTLTLFYFSSSTSLWAEERKIIEHADFENKTFKQIVDFSNVNFKPTARHWKSPRISFLMRGPEDTVYAKTSFRKTNFSNIATFSSTHFSEKVDFSSSNFSEKADFILTNFSKEASFFGTQFSRKTNFKYCKFSKNTHFLSTYFSERADFTGAEFLEKADFNNSKLPDMLIFYATKTAKEIDLSSSILDSSKAAQGRKCKIDLRNAPIEKFNFTYDNFQILKPDSVLSKKHFQELDIVYQKLLKNFKERGYTTSYESLDKEYKAFLFTQNPYDSTFSHGLNMVLNWINRVWHDYGYAKWYIFIHIGIFLSFFSLCNWLFFPQLLKAYKIQRIVDALPKNFDRDKKFNYKQFALSFFYTCLIFFGLKMDTSEFNFKKKRAVLYLFFQYIVGLVCLAYFTNFVISSNLIGG